MRYTPCQRHTPERMQAARFFKLSNGGRHAIPA